MSSLLSLTNSVGKGQTNDPDDVYMFDGALREIDAYDPPPEYANEPQRYPTAPMSEALERFQEQNKLKVDGYADPGGPTERAMNNRLLRKPRGSGLLYEPLPPISDTVGNGFKNERRDVQTAQRGLGALGYMQEDPFDRPHGFIDEDTTKGIRNYQSERGLTVDGWLAPGGETEKALAVDLTGLHQSNGEEWRDYWQREMEARSTGSLPDEGAEDTGIIPARVVPRPGPPVGVPSPGTPRSPGGQFTPRGPTRPQNQFQSPRRQYLSNPGELPPFDPNGRESSEPTLPFYGYTDEYDLLQWIMQQNRVNQRDREAGISIPGNERGLLLPRRSGYQGVPDGFRFKEQEFDGPTRDAANRVIGNSRGNEKTQNYNFSVVQWLKKLAEDHDCKVTHEGGSRDAKGNTKPETWLGPANPGLRPDGSPDPDCGPTAVRTG